MTSFGELARQDVAVANSGLTIDGDVVRKRYLRTDRGQPEREWAALALLQEHAPGLAPRPIARETEPPAVVMSRVEGAPLDEVLTPLQTCAMVAAYRLLYAVPVPPDMPLRFGHPAAFLRIFHPTNWRGGTISQRGLRPARMPSAPSRFVHVREQLLV